MKRLTVEERRTRDAACHQKWRDAHKEERAAKERARHAANREKNNARMKAYRQANPEKFREYERKRPKTEARVKASSERTLRWARRNPDRIKAIRKKHYEKTAEKQRKDAREWYRANRPLCLARLRVAHLRRLYGLTEEQYAALGSACGMCGATEDSRVNAKTGKKFRLAVDHDHDTGKVRGLLCGNCNAGIGYLKHDIALLERAIDYLRRTQ